jgi:hypothetical protein
VATRWRGLALVPVFPVSPVWGVASSGKGSNAAAPLTMRAETGRVGPPDGAARDVRTNRPVTGSGLQPAVAPDMHVLGGQRHAEPRSSTPGQGPEHHRNRNR